MGNLPRIFARFTASRPRPARDSALALAPWSGYRRDPREKYGYPREF